LKVEHRVEPDAVVVTVALVYGQPHQRTVQVATVRLQDDQPVQVRELTPFGVDPITLALEPAPPAFVILPKTASVSAMLEANVDLPSNDLPVYEITLKNRSTKAIAAVGFRGYRGEIEVLSGRRRSSRSHPVLEPDGLLRFTIQGARMGEAQGFDRFEVTGVLWADGSLDGDANLKTSEQAMAIGCAYQLRRVLALLGENSASSLAEIRSAVEKLPVKLSASEVEALAPNVQMLSSIEVAQVQVRTAVLDDLDAYMQAPHAKANAPAAVWIQDAVTRYSAWLRRTGVR
jgi:hypothetical protein